MAFPPVFTDVWDITQPPDTQQANLLGQDLRNLKNDIMQRLSLLSGTTANMPTPETVNATWGGAGFGLLFFATDTGIIWQWSGSAWVNVSAAFFNPSIQNVTALATPGTVNLGPGTQVGLSTTLAGALFVGDIIEVFTRVIAVTFSDVNQGQVNVGGATAFSFTMNAGGAYFAHVQMIVINATTAVPMGEFSATNGFESPGYATSVSIVLAGPNTFNFSLSSNPSSSTYSNDVLGARVLR